MPLNLVPIKQYNIKYNISSDDITCGIRDMHGFMGGGVVFKRYMYVMRCEWVIKLGEKFSLTNYVLILEETNAHRILVKYH